MSCNGKELTPQMIINCYKYTPCREGYLGGRDENGKLINENRSYRPEILFILREAKNKDGTEKSDDFWMWDIVYEKTNNKETKGSKDAKNIEDSKERRNALSARTKYFKKLEEISDEFIEKGENEQHSLFQCGFMNMHLGTGGSSKSDEYKEIMGNTKSEKFVNRIETIKKLNPKRIVTCMDIYEVLKNKYHGKNDRNKGICYSTRNKKMNKCIINIMDENPENNIELYEFYHPSCPSTLDSINKKFE